jgi:DNA-binding response OmpR family regulator
MMQVMTIHSRLPLEPSLTKLLLLEDDPQLAKTLVKYLGQHNYEVDWAKDGEEAVDMSFDNDYALYLFDINVPLLNGIDLLSQLREADDLTPTIIISALVDIGSVTKGFIAGADDYLKKPFDPEELLIRIKAKTSTLKTRFKHKHIEADTESREVYRDGVLVNLGEVQKNILLSLMQNYPNPVTKEELFLCLEKPSDLALRVNISKLKKQLGIEIKSVRGVGYQII